MGYGYRPSWRSANYRYVAQPSVPPSTEPKQMKARFAGKCETCNGQIVPGEDMLWIPATRKARHVTCPANPTPVQATPQIACPKCGQLVYQQMSKYGKPYFTNTANRQDFHPCRVWTGRRKSAGKVNIAPLGSSPTMSPLPSPPTAHATPTGAVPNPIVQAVYKAVASQWPSDADLERIVAYTEQPIGDVRTWTAVERDLAEIDKQISAEQAEGMTVGENDKFNTLVSDRIQCLNRLALLTWERIRYDS